MPIYGVVCHVMSIYGNVFHVQMEERRKQWEEDRWKREDEWRQMQETSEKEWKEWQEHEQAETAPHLLQTGNVSSPIYLTT